MRISLGVWACGNLFAYWRFYSWETICLAPFGYLLRWSLLARKSFAYCFADVLLSQELLGRHTSQSLLQCYLYRVAQHCRSGTVSFSIFSVHWFIFLLALYSASAVTNSERLTYSVLEDKVKKAYKTSKDVSDNSAFYARDNKTLFKENKKEHFITYLSLKACWKNSSFNCLFKVLQSCSCVVGRGLDFFWGGGQQLKRSKRVVEEIKF